jgi:predicted kinase
MKTPKIIFIIGNIGSGKSTWTKKHNIDNSYAIVSYDKTRYDLGNGKYVFNHILEPWVSKIEYLKCQSFMEQRFDIIVDNTSMSRKMRKPFITLAKKYCYTVDAYIFPDLGKEIHVKRRLNNPHGKFSRALWEEVYDTMKKAFQRPSHDEGFTNIFDLSNGM